MSMLFDVVINFNNTYVTLELRVCVVLFVVAAAAVAVVGEVAVEEESGLPVDFNVEELLDFFKLDVPEYS